MANVDDRGHDGYTGVHAPGAQAPGASFFTGRILSDNWGTGERETLMAGAKKKKTAKKSAKKTTKKKPAAKPTKKGPGCTTMTSTCASGCGSSQMGPR